MRATGARWRAPPSSTASIRAHGRVRLDARAVRAGRVSAMRCGREARAVLQPPRRRDGRGRHVRGRARGTALQGPAVRHTGRAGLPGAGPGRASTARPSSSRPGSCSRPRTGCLHRQVKRIVAIAGTHIPAYKSSSVAVRDEDMIETVETPTRSTDADLEVRFRAIAGEQVTALRRELAETTLTRSEVNEVDRAVIGARTVGDLWHLIDTDRRYKDVYHRALADQITTNNPGVMVGGRPGVREGDHRGAPARDQRVGPRSALGRGHVGGLARTSRRPLDACGRPGDAEDRDHVGARRPAQGHDRRSRPTPAARTSASSSCGAAIPPTWTRTCASSTRPMRS